MAPRTPTEDLMECRQKTDFEMKMSVRMVKFFLRLANLLCSVTLAVLLGITIAVFHSTDLLLPSRDGQRPWPEDTPIWIQDTLFPLSVIAIAIYTSMFRRYFRGRHRQAERIATKATLLSFFIGLAVWGLGFGLIQGSRTWGEGKDVWSWSCRSHPRFQEIVPYDLICKIQEWCLVCFIINIVATALSALVFVLTIYRLRSKRKLRKVMTKPHEAPMQFDPVPIPPPQYVVNGSVQRPADHVSSATLTPTTSPRRAFQGTEGGRGGDR